MGGAWGSEEVRWMMVWTLALSAMLTNAPSPGAGEEAVEIAGFLPDEVCGWRAAKPDGFYTADNLFDYINGGAEVYRSFNVRCALGRRYVKQGSAEIIADVFDMGAPEDAFGAYHHDVRDGVCPGIGQESEYGGGALAFWKGRYFVSIIALRASEESKSALLKLGEAVAGAISAAGAFPEPLAWLPEKALLPGQMHYFHDHSVLKSHYFLSEENLLGLGRETEGILARYRSAAGGSGTVVALVVRYPARRKARAVHRRFRGVYLPDADDEGLAQTEDGKWAGVGLERNVILGVFDAPSREDVRARLMEIRRRIIERKRRDGRK